MLDSHYWIMRVSAWEFAHVVVCVDGEKESERERKRRQKWRQTDEDGDKNTETDSPKGWWIPWEVRAKSVT